MPKQVFIESRNQTLEFPDEATQDQINDAVTAMFPPTGKDMADYVEGVKNAAMEGQDLVDPFQQMSDDNYVLFKQYQADKKTSPGEFFGIAKDTFNQVRDELATGIGTAAYKTYQGEGVEVAKSLGEGMQAGMIGTYDILNKIFDPAQPIPRKEDFVGKVAKPNYASNAFMGMGGMIPNAVGQDRVNTEEDYNNLIASEKQRDSEIVNRLYAMESTMRNASIPEVARGGQFVDPFLAAGLGGALVKVALKGGKTLVTKAAANAAAKAAARTAGTEGVETAAETAARTAAQGVDNIPPVYTGPEGQVMRPFTPDPNAPMGAFASTAPSPMAQAGLRAAETTAGAVQFTAGLPSQALKKLGELTETVLPGMGASAQAVPLVGAAMSDLGLTAGVVAGTKTTEKIAELLRSFARVSQQEASRAGAFERIALDPLTSAPVRKAAAGLAQFQPIARTVIDLSKGALKGGAAGSVVGAGLGGLAERSLEGAASGFGAGLALGGFYGSLNAGFDIGKETFGGSTARTRRNASGDINRFIASRPELEQAGWVDAMRVLVQKLGPERAASQMDALRVAEASGSRLRIATPDEAKQWKAPGWLDPDKGELVVNPPKLQGDTPAHEATHAIFASNVKRQYRAQIEEAIYGIPDPVTGGIVKAGFLDDAALAKVAEQIRDSYRKGDQTIAADRFEGFANNLKNSTDKESLIKARSAIADEMAADYGGKFFNRIRAGRFNPDRLPLVYRNALHAIDDGIYNTFKSVIYERGMDLGFDTPSMSFRDANGKSIRSPQLDEIFKRAFSQKSTAETVLSKKPDLIPVNPADRAIWARTHGGARGILNEDNTPKSMAQINAEAAARWQNMTSRLSPLPENEKIGLSFSRDESGKTTMTAQGQLSPAALTAILDSDMLDQSANTVLRDVIISMQNPEKSTFDTRYYKVYERGKGSNKMVAGVYPPSQNEILPYKVTMNSKDGINIHAVDMTKVRQRLATAMNKPQFKNLYSNPTEALKDFTKYLDNMTQVGEPAKVSAALLGGESGAAKRNLFYESLGFSLRRGETFSNIPDSVVKNANTVKTYRVERFTKLVDTGFKFPFEEGTTYYRGMKNFQPAAFTPETLPNGEAYTNPEGFRILNKAGSSLFRTYDETGKLIGIADSKEKAMRKAQSEFATQASKQKKLNEGIIDTDLNKVIPVRGEKDVVILTPESLKRFQPVGDIELDKLAGSVAYVMPADRMKKGKIFVGPPGHEIELPIEGQGGAGFMEVEANSGWAWTVKKTAEGTVKRVVAQLNPNETIKDFIIVPTLQSKNASLSNKTSQLAWKYSLKAAVDGKVISRAEADAFVKMITSEAHAKSKGKDGEVPIVSTLNELFQIPEFPVGIGGILRKEMMKDRKKSSMSLDWQKSVGIDYERLASQVNDQRFDHLDAGTMVAAIRFDINAKPQNTGLHYSYPWQIKGTPLGYLKDPMSAYGLIGDYQSTVFPVIQGEQFSSHIALGTQPRLVGLDDYIQKSGTKATQPETTNISFSPSSITARDINAIAKEVGGGEVKGGAKKFGAFMREMRDKGVTLRDVVKSYGITLSSIQRQELLAQTIKKNWPDAPFKDGVKIRPEDAFATLLGTEEGKKYLDSAEQGTFDEGAVDAMMQKFKSFGFQNKLKEKMKVAAQEFFPKASSIIDAVNTMPADEFAEFVRSNVSGISYGKVGFWSGQLGRGDIPTFDSRMGKLVYGKEVLVTKKVLMEQKERLPMLGITVPDEYKDFAQTLLHHEVWDRLNNSDTEHAPIKDAMLRFSPLSETEANAKLKQSNMAGQYGAWISPKGELFKFRTMYGHAEEIEKLVPSVKIKSPDDYNKVYDKKWVRVVNDRSNIYLTTTKPLNAEQRSTIDFMGVENEKNIILNNTQSEKIVYTHIKFQPDPASPNILNGSDGSRIIKSTSGKYRVYLATGALAGVKETLESAQKLIERKSNK